MPFETTHSPRLAYNANGLRSLSLSSAIQFLARCGYTGIELSLNRQHVDPWGFTDADVDELRGVLEETGVVACSLATGDPLLLSERAFEPALVDLDPLARERRLDLLRRAIRIGVRIGVPIVVFSTGRLAEGADREQALSVLDEAVAELLGVLEGELRAAGAAPGSTVLGVEPEPGFLLETNAQVAELIERTGSEALWLSQDLGHTVVVEEDALESLRRHLPLTRHLQVEDIAGRVHAHLVPGEGDIDFESVGRVLHEEEFAGWISVELYDHDHVHGRSVPDSRRFLLDRLPSLGGLDRAGARH
ncbi:sugar phosphate isomerase/epimerase family protein [Kocuria arenosa]|uniref:sugar phosphate isomerase/epimerase family protein n=1 Tax=Kocuria arenosa TaxID=3071446 RepID=UPI0034D61FEE